jgi:hypothetical protein
MDNIESLDSKLTPPSLSVLISLSSFSVYTEDGITRAFEISTIKGQHLLITRMPTTSLYWPKILRTRETETQKVLNHAFTS